MKKKILALVLATFLSIGLCACGDSGLAVVDDNTYEVYSAEGLINLAKMVNENKKTFSGKTILLAADIDMSGVKWIPIGLNGSNAFCGTFDGQGHTISNLVVELGDGYYAAGLFGYVNGAVKDLAITDSVIHIHSHNHGAVMLPSGPAITITSAGAVCGMALKNSKIENVHVQNCEIISGDFAGAIVGSLQGNLEFCSSSDVSLNANEIGELYVDWNHEGNFH